ncbi:helix-turn-helix domain-containing protein [Desulfosarcina ovata]|uniref:Helix-turn-helix domain-containing protein n=2 Tax=Desulfosarcina ovata TaxID=83564 RepID=A0A5K8A3J3_9BACT|nr:helix-turn-helix domain-containing protein [Desulfosarcina ovata]BBO80350.1 hypothetical protein DSCO28_09160 [Desulfosarcina ovata subsp. sediminis]BBO87115.1 hypothetical protein DSCOOX_02950 [Desulfosarcina ovata subsp. ovata]
MTDTAKTLTTAEFSKITGMAVSTITQMLRQGRLHGEKRSGKWAIFESELPDNPVTENKIPKNVSSQPSPAEPKKSIESYTVETFARMTYLTEKGVRQWLKTGRLTEKSDENGQKQVDAVNLERPELQHLLRK